MALTAKNWKLTSYTTSTYTDLISASAATVVKSLVIATGANAATVKVRVTDSGGTSLYMVVPSESLAANGGYRLDISALCLNNTEKLQVQASASGVEFSAHGFA